MVPQVYYVSSTTAVLSLFLQKTFVSVEFSARPVTFEETNQITLTVQFTTK